MKFAVAALIASTTAIQIRGEAQKKCLTPKETDWAFGKLDADKNGSLDYAEIKTGLDYVAKEHNYTPTDADWAWVEKVGKKIDAKTPGKVDKKEFFVFANAVAEHFDICPSGLAEVEVTKGCLDRKETNWAYGKLDTNKDGSLSYGEIKKGLEYVAKEHDYTPTKADWAWVVKTGKKIDSKTPGKVDEGEFFVFANAVAEHFHLCPSGLAEIESMKKGCLSKKETNEGFDKLDTNQNGSLSYGEIKAGIEWVAKQHNYTPTEADWAWVEKTGKRIDKKNPGKVNRREFHRFANAFAKHFELCPKA